MSECAADTLHSVQGNAAAWDEDERQLHAPGGVASQDWCVSAGAMLLALPYIQRQVLTCVRCSQGSRR